MRLIPLIALVALLAAALPGAAAAQEPGTGSPNLDFVKNIPYPAKVQGKNPNHGTDIEFVTIRKRKYALAGSYYNGLQIVDITKPSQARTVATYDCPIRQGDVQVFKAADGSKRTLVSYTSDAGESAAIAKTGCFEEAARLGFETRQPNGGGKQGTFLIDITNPANPLTLSFVEVPLGSHNQSVHPSGGWLYNSNSELITNLTPSIEIIDIRNPRYPRRAGELKLDARPGLGTNSHDITFSDDGRRAYSSALSHGVIIDSSNPGEPKILSTFDDEAINVWHQSDPMTLKGKDGRERDFLVVEDEFAGAAGGPVCPSGGVHVYETTGALEKAPKKVGYWNITDNAGPTHDPEGTCTAHVFDIHERERLMTIAFYNGGVRVVDLAGLLTGDGIEAIASYKTKNADSWSFKAPTVTRTGVFYAYGNDIARGLDIYRFDGGEPQSKSPGTWIPGPALAASGSRSATGVQLPELPAGQRAGAGSASLAGYRMSCLIQQ